MLTLLKNIGGVLANDATIQSYVSDRIYLAWKPKVATPSDYPQITLRSDLGLTDEHREVYFMTLWVDVWSKNSQTQMMSISKRVLELLDGKNFIDGNWEAYRLKKIVSPIMYEDDTLVWHESIQFEVVTKSYTAS